MSLALGRQAAVRVPASSANLGPGFDVLGLSLAFYDECRVEVVPGPDRVELEGQGERDLPRDGSHLVLRSLRAGLEAVGESAEGLWLRCRNRIPQARGMGSSSAAIVAGLALARGLARENQLTLDQLVDLAGRLEGHPDNVAACLLGGMTLAWTDATGHHAVRMDVHPEVVPVVSVPAFKVPTEEARALLPRTVSLADAVFNLSRSSLLVHALTRDPGKLWVATEDRLHQQQRAAVMPATWRVVAALRGEGLPAVVSGAGPTVLTLAGPQEAWRVQEIVEATESGFETMVLAVDPSGVQAL